ncbi:DUF4339 domain-containing protein [Ralstonia pickettii]|uniref:DUF4339 domain-containing protein n=1 Tax=Ralstonia pickettii TaxID=329 RepID=UPI0015BBB4C8|nr:DUF4339 domain-containing protein [Ralstonia pickettii]NWK43331.1 DUF4339 domain-containing protein [Ralstonia pickettii]
MTAWYYEKNGQRLGAVTSEAIAQLLAKQDIDRNTLVWKQGMAAWSPLSKTELVSHLQNSTEPPVLPPAQMDNKFLWLLAFSPVICWIAEVTCALFQYGDIPFFIKNALENNHYWYTTVAILLGLGWADYKALEKAGVNLQKLNKFWILLTPGYIWKRCQMLNQGYKFVWIWLASFIVSGILTSRL